MIVKVIFLATTISSFVLFPYVLTVPFAANDGNANTTGLLLIGPADGKLFFADSTQMSWAAANELCTSSKYQLAIVNGNDTIKLLKENLTSTGPFWTSGRDVGNLTQFMWNNDPSNPIDPTIVNLEYAPRQCSCLFFNRISATDGKFGGGPCSAPAGVLCQISVSKATKDEIKKLSDRDQFNKK